MRQSKEMDAAWLDFIRDSQSSGEGLVEQRFLQRRQSGVLGGGRWGDPIHEKISRGDSYPQKYFKGLQGQDLSESHAMIELGGGVCGRPKWVDALLCWVWGERGGVATSRKPRQPRLALPLHSAR